MSVNRAIAKAKMAAAIRAGQNAAGFISQMRSQGFGYDNKLMYSDWRAAKQAIGLEGALQTLRPTQRPSTKTMAEVEWQISKEYMYKVKVIVSEKGRKGTKERFVNILSDTRLTVQQIERAAKKTFTQSENYGREVVESLQAWTAYHRV